MASVGSDLEIAARQRVIEEETARQDRMRLAWAAYNGDYPKTLRIRTVRGKPGPDDNVELNYAKRFVQTAVSALFGNPLEIDLQEDAPGEYLDEAWPMARRMLSLQQAAQNGAIAGHAVMKLQLPKARYGEQYPRVVVIDPMIYSCSWEPDDTERIYAHRLQWPATDGDGKPWIYRQRIILADSGGSWEIIDERQSPSASSWSETARATWGYSWSPIAACQNLPAANEVYGEADLEPDVLRVIYAINRVASYALRIIRLHGHPRPWAKGLTPNQVAAIDVTADGVISIPGEGELRNLEMNPSGLAPIVDYLRRLIDLAHELVRVPRITTGKLESSGPMSGVALKVHYSPLTEVTGQKQLTYGGMIEHITKGLVALGGKGTFEELLPVLTWPEVVPADPKEEAETFLLDHELGASKKTLLQKRGYDPELEAAQREEDAKSTGAAMIRSFDTGAAGGEAYANGQGPMMTAGEILTPGGA